MTKIIFDKVCGNCIYYNWKKNKCNISMLNLPSDEPACIKHHYRGEE